MSWKVEPINNEYLYYDITEWLDEKGMYDDDEADEVVQAAYDLFILLHDFTILKLIDFHDGEPTIWIRNAKKN